MIYLDPVTRAEYEALQSADARAQLIVSAFASPVAVRVYDGTGTVRGFGTMTDPWATVMGQAITVGVAAAFNVTSSGSPSPDQWTLRFESGSRWISGSFGLSDSLADFTWSLPAWEAGQFGALSTVALVSTGPAVEPPPIEFGWAQIPTITFTQGTAGSAPLEQFLVGEEGIADLSFSINSGTLPAGVTINVETGVLSYDGTSPAGSATVTVKAEVAKIADLTISAAGTSPVAWTCGHTFRPLDLPAGSRIDGVQTNVQNWWPDGSIKFAILSGVNAPGVLEINRTDAAAPAGEVAAIVAGDVAGAVMDLGIYGTASLVDAINGGDLSSSLPRTAGTRPPTAGKLRDRIVGPIMRESHYYAPATTDTQLGVIFAVRKYIDGTVEIETAVENGWFGITNMLSRTYTASITIGGTPRPWHDNLTSREIAHPPYTRWSRVDRVVAGTVEVIPSAAYLVSTRLVPNYGWPVATSENAFTFSETYSGSFMRSLASISLAESNAPTPLDRGLFRNAQAGGGDFFIDQIGLLMHDASVFCRTGDVRAYRAVLHSGRCVNFLPTWRRDERTLALPRTDNISRITAAYGNAEREHQPDTGYFAYLLTGRQVFLENCQNTALWNFFNAGTPEPWPVGTMIASRGGSKGLLVVGNTTRGIAWPWRSLATALCISPDGSGHRSDLLYCLEQNIQYFWGLQSGSPMANSLGLVWCLGVDNLNSNRDPAQTEELFLTVDPWQHSFLSSAIGMTRDLQLVGSPYAENLQALHEFSVGPHVGIMGFTYDGSGFSWRRASIFRNLVGYPTEETLGTGRVPASFRTSWRDVYEKTLTYCGAVNEPDGSPTTQSAFTTPQDQTSAFTYGFKTPAVEITALLNPVAQLPYIVLTRNVVSALAIGADHGVTGAAAAYARLVGSPPYATDATARQKLADFPRYMVTPR